MMGSYGLTSWGGEVWETKTLPPSNSQPPRLRDAAVLTATDMRRVQGLVRGTVEARQAALTVDARGVVLGIQGTQSSPSPGMSPFPSHRPTNTWPVLACLAYLAIEADAPTLVHIVLVLAGITSVYLRVIVTVVGMAMAVAGCRIRANS